MEELTLNEYERIRREKMQALKDKGVDPFGSAFKTTHHSLEILNKYENNTKEEIAEINEHVIIAGRIMTKREMGKAGFMHLLDRDGQIQVYVRKDSISELEFEIFTEADLGDIVGIEGHVFRTNHGEISIKAEKLTHLTKALRPLPDKFHGLADVEERYRRRYVDLIVNENARRVAMLRPRIIRARLFRNEGMSPKHNPEFTTVEAYLAYSDMPGMMEVIENCLESVAKEVLGKTEVPWADKMIELKGPYRRVHMVDAVKETCGVDFFKINSIEEALKVAKEHHIEVLKHQQSFGHILNLFFEHYAEKAMIQPTFVYGHPIEISPLAKKNQEDPRFTDRFELFIDGREYANAFSELNDPIDQRERFEEQTKEKDLGNGEANEMDVDFVESLEYGMPPTGGLGIGIDRLVMLLTNSETIREVILFPHMRHRD